MTNDQVVRNFADRKENRRTGQVEWSSNNGNLYCFGDVLYSYGSHFPLAVYRGNDTNERAFFLKNGDKYSITTSCHQSITQSYCQNGPTVSFRALRAAGLNPEAAAIIDYRMDSWETVCFNRTDGKYYTDSQCTKPFKKPKQGQFVAHPSSNGEEIITGSWHILGATLFQHPDNGKQYLASYFISELKHRAKSVETAFYHLMPHRVKKTIAQGIEVKRQGEWFFIPLNIGKSDASLAQYLHIKIARIKSSYPLQNSLPRQSTQSNRHVCRLFKYRNQHFCSGTVFHWESWRNQSSGQHASLKLDSWHIAYKNTEIQSWSFNGSFD